RVRCNHIRNIITSRQPPSNSAIENGEETYTDADSEAVSTWYANMATDEKGAIDGWVTAEVTRTDTDAAAQDWYDHQADAQLVPISDQRDTLSKAFAEQEANTWQTALSAAANNSPWM